MVITAHFDSKLYPVREDKKQFLAAVDSAVPVAMILSMMDNLNELLKKKQVIISSRNLLFATLLLLLVLLFFFFLLLLFFIVLVVIWVLFFFLFLSLLIDYPKLKYHA